jgi:hypothetical protein
MPVVRIKRAIQPANQARCLPSGHICVPAASIGEDLPRSVPVINSTEPHPFEDPI